MAISNHTAEPAPISGAVHLGPLGGALLTTFYSEDPQDPERTNNWIAAIDLDHEAHAPHGHVTVTLEACASGDTRDEAIANVLAIWRATFAAPEAALAQASGDTDTTTTSGAEEMVVAPSLPRKAEGDSDSRDDRSLVGEGIGRPAPPPEAARGPLAVSIDLVAAAGLSTPLAGGDR